MRHISLSVWIWLGSLSMLCASVSCSNNAAEQVPRRAGRLEVALTATSSSGAQYRLRNGTFRITGTSTKTLSSDAQPDAPTLTTELAAGQYSIELVTGWSLQKRTASGSFESVKAALGSANPVAFTIVDQLSTSVLYRFNVGNDVVAFGNGRLVIGIDVDEQPGDGGLATDGASPPTDGLMLYVTFDNREAMLSPEVGPAGTILGNPVFTPGRRGSALHVTAVDGREVVYPGAVVSPNRGTIECWARLVEPPTIITWTASPAFFWAQTERGDIAYTMEFNGNDGVGGGGLVAAAGDGSTATGCFATERSYAEILGGESATQTWHHYAMAWDSAGIPGIGEPIQAFLDGRPVGTFDACGTLNLPTRWPTLTELSIGFIQSWSPGSTFEIDELRVWDHAKSQFDVP